ncbi:MAG: hypothetical protein ACLQUY_07725 [Ktedonobacterales bacterium]
MRDGTTRRSRDPQRGSGDVPGSKANPYAPGLSSRVPIPRQADSGQGADPYRQYDPRDPGMSTRPGTRMPTLGSATLYGASAARQSEVWTSARLEAAVAHKHRIGITVFHDGNPGHLWRGELASRFGEVLVDVGVLIWLAALLQSAVAVALAVVALGLPFLLVGPFGAGLENASHPGAALKWLNNLRIVLVLGLVLLFFHIIVPAVYGLLFLLSLCGRLHDAARIGAIRSCLAPGEPEHVANDIFIGGAVASVLGPILATLIYVLVGERVIAVDILAAAAFLVSGNSEGLLDALPPERRAFLLATPEALYPDGEVPALAHTPDEADLLEDEEWREESLPAWYQQGPTSAGQALGELRAGLGLAGAKPGARLALCSVSGLALAGGAFSTLAVFYITSELGLPPFYLGPFLAAEAAGLVLGSLAVASADGSGWRSRLWFGLVGTGLLFIALSVLPLLLLDLVLALLIGFMTAMAVAGARRALYFGFDPVEQRAVSAAENWVAALGAVIGAIMVGLFVGGTEPLAGMPKLLGSVPGWSASEMLILLGLGLVVAAFLVLVLGRGETRGGRAFTAESSLSQGRGSGELGIALDDLDSSYYPASGGDDGGWDAALAEEDEWAGFDDQDGQDDQLPPSSRRQSRNARPPRW